MFRKEEIWHRLHHSCLEVEPRILQGFVIQVHKSDSTLPALHSYFCQIIQGFVDLVYVGFLDDVSRFAPEQALLEGRKLISVHRSISRFIYLSRILFKVF